MLKSVHFNNSECAFLGERFASSKKMLYLCIQLKKGICIKEKKLYKSN